MKAVFIFFPVKFLVITTLRPKLFLPKKNIFAKINMAGKKAPKQYSKTDERVQVGNRNCIVYEGKRGGKYVKYNGEFITLTAALNKKYHVLCKANSK